MIKKIKGIIETDGLSRKMKILFIFYLTDVLVIIGSFVLFITDTSYDFGNSISVFIHYIYLIVFEISTLLLVVVSIVLLIIWMIKKIKNKKSK